MGNQNHEVLVQLRSVGKTGTGSSDDQETANKISSPGSVRDSRRDPLHELNLFSLPFTLPFPVLGAHSINRIASTVPGTERIIDKNQPLGLHSS